MSRVAVRIQQIEGQGVNATQLKMELETLRNQVLERVMEFEERLNVTRPSGYDVDIEIPDVPQFSMGKGNNTQRGPPLNPPLLYCVVQGPV